MHPNALLSGAYYLQAPPGAGRLFFSDPRVQAQMLTPNYDPARPRPPEGWAEVYFEAIVGRLILFPAWLLHEVEQNLAEGEGAAADRVSLSFNIHQGPRAVPGAAATAA